MGCYPHFILPTRSSRGFASTAANQKRPFQTRFRYGSAAAPLNRADNRKSPDHYAKGTPSPLGGLQIEDCRFAIEKPAQHCCSPVCHLKSAICNPPRRAPTACRHVVSGSLSSPQRGSSHLSLALLGTLSVAGEYLALRDGPRSFRPASTCPVLLRCQAGGLPRRVRDCHPLWSLFPELFR
jgi:hypothetical protein